MVVLCSGHSTLGNRQLHGHAVLCKTLHVSPLHCSVVDGRKIMGSRQCLTSGWRIIVTTVYLIAMCSLVSCQGVVTGEGSAAQIAFERPVPSV